MLIMLEKIKQTITKYGLLKQNERVIVGLSGGLRKTAVTLAEKALEALEKDLYSQPTKPVETPASSTTTKDQSEGSN